MSKLRKHTGCIARPRRRNYGTTTRRQQTGQTARRRTANDGVGPAAAIPETPFGRKVAVLFKSTPRSHQEAAAAIVIYLAVLGAIVAVLDLPFGRICS
jgi:hypothetical protein